MSPGLVLELSNDRVWPISGPSCRTAPPTWSGRRCLARSL